ncbi:hypothetical protein SUGI_0086890 [Cryptomeria japonica]|uniref:uncharacterized protein LOC131050481 n=1 Tax=Cryptomeria japonica TaxID=3369 RepID=UPI002408C0EF|nr:uncharacterized protein LOC131050481 [Cryptomeria japonica]GLJ08348.1 hypothetical protein SUGI_0086890 [Cryptomeria japonica]
MGLFTNTPVASGPILPDPSWWMQRDFTRKYHAQVFQQELAFRERLAHMYASPSSHELLQQDFSKSSNQILQQEYSTNLQWNSSKSPDSVLPKQPGWSSFCEVDSKTEVLEKCNFIDKKVLMSKELKEGSDNGREENLEQQKIQTEQQQQERDISDDLEKQEKSRKNDSIPFNECQISLKSNQLTTEECLTCNKVFKSQKDFESHLAERKHAKQLSQIICVQALSEVKDGSKKCENAGEKKLISIDSRLLVKDNVEKILEKELDEKVKYNGDLVAKEDNVGMKENAELNEQQQIMVGAMPSKLWSSNYVTGDEQKCSEKPVWKARDDKDLGPKINEVDMKENAELIDQHQMKEGNSKQQKVQIEQHLTEDSSNQQNPQIEQQMVEGGMPSLKSNQSRTEECVACNKVFKSQDDFKSHLAGKKHAKQLLERVKCIKALSEVKGDSKKCENAGKEILMSIDSGLLVKDNVEKRSEKELVEKVRYNGDLVAKEDKVGMKEIGELNEQQQIMVDAMPSKLCKRSSNLSELRIKNCKISYVKGDEQKNSENKPVWKAEDDKDFGAKINEVDMKENAELIDQHQMKEGNSKQQKVQIEQQMAEGNSKQQSLQMEQQMTEGNSKQQSPQMKQQMTEGNSKQQSPQMKQQMTEGNSKQQSLQMEQQMKSNKSRTEECVACNKVFSSQEDFKSHLAGRKHAKQVQRIKCIKVLSEVKDDSKKCENAGEKILINIDSGLPVKDNMEKRLEKELVGKVKYNGDLVAKEDKVGMQENSELNEQQQIMVGAMPSKLCKSSSNLSELSVKNCKISYVKRDEQKSSENKPVWKAKDDKDLGSKINEVDMKENTELIDQHQMKEGNSKQKKLQIEQQMIEGHSKQQNPQMEQQMMEGETPSLKSNQLRTEECVACNKVFNSQDDFKSHLAGKKHAKQLLQRTTCVKALSEVKDDSKKCENAVEKILISIDSELLVKDNIEKRLEKELAEKVRYNGDLVIKEDKVGMKENAELNEQQQIMAGAIPSNLCKRSSNLSELSIENCKLSYVKCDEQKSSENKPVWKAKYDEDLGAKINEVDMKENEELIDRHQMKEGISKQQKVQIEQQMIEGNSKQQKPQMDQQMLGGGTTSKEYGESLNSNPLKIKECVMCNIALQVQDAFEVHLSGRKHAKQLKKMETKVVREVADDSDFDTKSNKVGIKETDEHELEQMNTRGVSSKVCKMLSNASQVSIEECKISREKDDVDISDKNKLVWKVKDDRNLDAKRNRVDMKENAELNEQCLLKEGNSEQQNFQYEQKMNEGKSKQQKLQMEEQMKEENSKTQKLQMKQQIMENGLRKKQHERLTSEQLKVNGYMMCNTALNFQGDSEAELARRKHAKQLKKMENKLVWKVTDKRDLCSKTNNFVMKETTVLSEKQHMKGMKETAELSEKQHMKEGCMSSKICKNLSNASQLSINQFKIPITKDKVDKGAINQPVRKVNQQQWMRKTNTKQQKLQTEQQLQEKHN